MRRLVNGFHTATKLIGKCNRGVAATSLVLTLTLTLTLTRTRTLTLTPTLALTLKP